MYGGNHGGVEKKLLIGRRVEGRVEGNKGGRQRYDRTTDYRARADKIH
jgi:hypothetical protein